MENTKNLVLTPKQLDTKPHFYASCETKKGEPIHLFMVLITKENEPHWKRYVNSSQRMASITRGILTFIATKIKKYTENDIQTYRYEDEYTPELEAAVGYSKEAFDAFVIFLGQQGFTSENTKKINILKQNSSGSHHIHLCTKGFQYVTYACKTSDFLIEQFESPDNVQNMSLKTYVERYNSLLMCVGSDFSETDSYYTRGIFRNPYSVIENTYKGLAMMLHGFTAAVAKEFFKEKREMHVAPVSSMQYLISSHLRPEDYTIRGLSHMDALKRSQTEFENVDGFEYPLNCIKVDALANLYYDLKKHQETEHNLFSFFTSFGFTEPSSKKPEPDSQEDRCRLM